MPINNGRHLSGKTHLHLMYTFRFTIRSNRTVQAILKRTVRYARSGREIRCRLYAESGFGQCIFVGRSNGKCPNGYLISDKPFFSRKASMAFCMSSPFSKNGICPTSLPHRIIFGNALSGNVAGRRSSRSYRKKTGRVSQPRPWPDGSPGNIPETTGTRR